MSSNCSNLFREHGCKLWFSNFLGYSLLFWVISWVSSASSFPTSCGEFFDSIGSSFSSPVGIIKFLVFAGLFLIIPAFLQSAGTSATIEAVSRNRSSVDTYFTQGIENLGRMYQLTLASIVCYLPAIFVSKHTTFQFTDFSFSNDNLLSILAIALYAVTALSLLHAPYILVAENTTACGAIRQSFSLFTSKCTSVFVSLLNVAFIYGIVIGSAYYFNPDIFNSLHPIRFLLASIAVSLSMFAVTYRYYKRFRSDSTSTASISGGCGNSPVTSSSSCSDSNCVDSTASSNSSDSSSTKNE